MNGLEPILTRWRFAAKTAHSDIGKCYHRISTSLPDNSLRSLWLKPVLGTDVPWEEFCLTKVSFGDILGGCVSTCAIWDASERFMHEEARSNLSQNIYMDDISLLQYFDTPGGCDDLIKEVDQGLVRGSLPVKGWIQTGDIAPPTKFLSYNYLSGCDSIQVRPKVNWSKKRRGARISPNVTNDQELRQHFKENPVTKRSCLAITMGTLHDPLYLMGPYQLNLKCLYKKVVLLGLEWDQRIPRNLELEILQSFLSMERVLFSTKSCIH